MKLQDHNFHIRRDLRDIALDAPRPRPGPHSPFLPDHRSEGLEVVTMATCAHAGPWAPWGLSAGLGLCEGSQGDCMEGTRDSRPSLPFTWTLGQSWGSEPWVLERTRTREQRRVRA